MSGIVHLKEEVAQLTQERTVAQEQVTQLRDLLQEERNASYTMLAELVQARSDVQAAFRASELAAKHREALEQLIREYHRQHDVQLLRDWNQRCACSSCKRATALLSEVKHV